MFHFFQYVGKFLKCCCTTKCFLFSLKTTWYLKINLGLNQVTPALTSSYHPWDLQILWWWVGIRGVFLDISKAFDKVWHQDVILKLKQNGISGNVLKISKDFPSNSYQRVVLHGQSFGWVAVNPGVPQCSILGPLLFLVYINDLSIGSSSNPRLFADDISLFFSQWIK